MRILLADNGDDDRARLTQQLRQAGHHVTVAASVLGARRLLAREPIEFLVVERSLPDGDGLDVVSWLRELGDDRPAIALSRRSSPRTRARGLRGGFDDCMDRPCDADELLARIEAVARRSGRLSVVQVGALRMDTASRRVELDGRRVDLTVREFELLEALARAAPAVRSRGELLEEVWQSSEQAGSNLVDVYVRYLRSKLGSRLIRTVRGVGYALDPAQDRSARPARALG